MSDLSVNIPSFRKQPLSQRPPVELLREAARNLATQTGGVVEGSVFTSNPGDSNLFRHTFYLRARTLNDYTYPLFYVWHGAELYPVKLLMAGEASENATSYQGDVEFRDKLQEIFASPGTAQLVYALMAQAGE